MAKTSTSETATPANHTRLVVKLLVAVVGMFGFGFALVPLYDILCEQLGINGKTSEVAAEAPAGLEVDTSRVVRVEFMSHTNGNIPWEFYPQKQVLEVHPGEVIQTHYIAKNLSSDAMTGQAVPSVSPGLGATHFNKIECFCFNSQPLEGNQETEMGLLFYIEHDLPESIHTLTLSYTLYDITQPSETQSEESQATLRTQNGAFTSFTTLTQAANAAFHSGVGFTQVVGALNEGMFYEY